MASRRLALIAWICLLLGGCVGLQESTDAFGRKSYRPVYDGDAPLLEALGGASGGGFSPSGGCYRLSLNAQCYPTLDACGAAGRQRSSETGMGYNCRRSP